MEDQGKRRDLLNLWASEFLYMYRPEEKTLKVSLPMFKRLIRSEHQHGRYSTSKWMDGEIEPSELYKAGLGYVSKWEVPITIAGLAGVVYGCKDIRQVKMVLAAVHRRFVSMTRSFDLQIDAIVVAEILEYGHPSAEYFVNAWARQKMPSLSQDKGQLNLLDHIKATDFYPPPGNPSSSRGLIGGLFSSAV